MFPFLERLKNAFMNNFWNKMSEQWGAYVLQFIVFAVLFYLVFKVLKENKGGKLIVLFTLSVIVCGLAFGFSENVDTQMILIVIIMASLLVMTMFNTEIKRELLDAGAKRNSKHEDLTVSHIEHIIDETIRAVQHMSKNDIGALIVLSNENLPEGVVSSGTVINADINAPMVEAVFYPKAPLHDGAMIIEGNKIHAAGCFLPIIQDDTLPQEVGSRHRAALGITSVASVTAIVVSEETGIISIIKNGEIKKRYASDADLKNALSEYYWSDLTAGNN
jgi:diadenylate cyclase